jgi:hypothetical protein
MPDIPIYPEGGIRQPDGTETIAATVEDLQAAINSHGQVHGYALNRRSAANYKDGKPTRWVLQCDRHGKPPASPLGLGDGGGRTGSARSSTRRSSFQGENGGQAGCLALPECPGGAAGGGAGCTAKTAAYSQWSCGQGDGAGSGRGLKYLTMSIKHSALRKSIDPAFESTCATLYCFWKA